MRNKSRYDAFCDSPIAYLVGLAGLSIPIALSFLPLPDYLTRNAEPLQQVKPSAVELIIDDSEITPDPSCNSEAGQCEDHTP